MTGTTALFLDFDGAAVSDDSIYGGSRVFEGQVTTTDADSKYGGSSLLTNGIGLQVFAVADEFNFGTGDFTIEFWVKRHISQPVEVLFFGQTGFYLLDFNGALHIRLQSHPAWNDIGFFLPLDTWVHLAVTRKNSVMNVFANGIILAASFVNPSPENFAAAGQDIRIGTDLGTASYAYFDDVLITKGEARYIANFTPQQHIFNRYYLNGTVKDADGSWIPRIVRAYRGDTGALVDQVLSDAITGEFSLECNKQIPHYVVVRDIDTLNGTTPALKNALIYDFLTPV